MEVITPIAGWFTVENPKIKWMIWGYPYFRKPLETRKYTSISGVPPFNFVGPSSCPTS